MVDPVRGCSVTVVAVVPDDATGCSKKAGLGSVTFSVTPSPPVRPPLLQVWPRIGFWDERFKRYYSMFWLRELVLGLLEELTAS